MLQNYRVRVTPVIFVSTKNSAQGRLATGRHYLPLAGDCTWSDKRLGDHPGGPTWPGAARNRPVGLPGEVGQDSPVLPTSPDALPGAQ